MSYKLHTSQMPKAAIACTLIAALLSIMDVTIGSGSDSEPSSAVEDRWAIYHPDPKNIWNRVFRALYERTAPDGTQYGYNELDPLLWPNTGKLVKGPSYEKALALLDEFASSHGEKLIRDPFKRTLFQRDLWAIFEWTVRRGGHSSLRKEDLALQERLVDVMQRVALSRGQIESLPDTYLAAARAEVFPTQYDSSNPSRPFLPPNLWDPEGPWVLISSGNDFAAQVHVKFLGRPSLFFVFLKLPDKRQAALDYLKKLEKTSLTFPIDLKTLPPLPQGSMVALVRTMFLISNEGYPYPTPITESIQIRVFREPRKISRIPEGMVQLGTFDQDFYMFKLDREALFSDKPSSLVPVTEQDLTFHTDFLGTGIDPFEWRGLADGTDPFRFWIDGKFRRVRILDSCLFCHNQPGIMSVGTFMQAWSDARLPHLQEGGRGHQESLIGQWKRNDFSWGYLLGLWHSQSERNRD